MHQPALGGGPSSRGRAQDIPQLWHFQYARFAMYTHLWVTLSAPVGWVSSLEIALGSGGKATNMVPIAVHDGHHDPGIMDPVIMDKIFRDRSVAVQFSNPDYGELFWRWIG